MKKLLPLFFLFVGSGVGVAAGSYLRSVPPSDESLKTEMEAEKVTSAGIAEKDVSLEYLKMSNQFVVPVVRDRIVTSLVVMSLSLELPEGTKEAVFRMEPKIRDSFLQVMFDHANIGGFDGSFTDASKLNQLRTALREVAERDLGNRAVRDVLITEIARQDY